MGEDLWQMLRTGKTEQALRRMREAYRAEPSTSRAMEWGVACLWVGDNSTAFEHFNEVIQEHGLHATVIYGMAGVAKWCMNQPAEAVHCWKTGLDCEFSDTAGLGVKLPLFLFFASVVRPDVIPTSEAIRLLPSKIADSRAEGWSGALAKFVLGRINEEQLRAQCTHRYDDETILHQWLSDFYVGAVAHANGDNVRYRELMRRVGAVSWHDYDSNSRAFLSRLWSGEYFLSHHEVADTASSSTVG